MNHDSPDEQRLVEAARSLLIIIPSQPTDLRMYEEFHRMVNLYNEKPPFGFPNPFNEPKKVRVWCTNIELKRIKPNETPHRSEPITNSLRAAKLD